MMFIVRPERWVIFKMDKILHKGVKTTKESLKETYIGGVHYFFIEGKINTNIENFD